MLDFYWKLGRDIEAKQYTNTYGSGFYKNLSQDLKNEMPGVKGFSPTNLKYMSYFYKLYAPLQANCPQDADNFIEDLYIADIQRVVAQSENRPQTADDFKLLFLIPWDHHRRIIDKCKGNMDKALFFVRKTWENNWGRDVLLNWLDTDLYERDGKAITNFQATLPAVQSDLAQQITKDPYQLDFLNLREKYDEHDIEEELVNNVTRFLLELGKGFSYMGRQFRLEIQLIRICLFDAFVREIDVRPSREAVFAVPHAFAVPQQYDFFHGMICFYLYFTSLRHSPWENA